MINNISDYSKRWIIASITKEKLLVREIIFLKFVYLKYKKESLLMERDDIIKATMQIVEDFEQRVSEVPGAWALARHYQTQLDEIEIDDADDERRFYGLADDILGSIGLSTEGLPGEVISHIRGQIRAALRAL